MEAAAATSERAWQELLGRLEPWARRAVVGSALELELHDLVDEAVRLRLRGDMSKDDAVPNDRREATRRRP